MPLAAKLPVVVLSMGLEDVAEAMGGAKGKALARTAAALDTYLGRIGGPVEKKDHFARLAKMSTPALAAALADVLARYQPDKKRLRAYGGDSELIAYLFLLARAGHGDARACWQRFVDASPAEFACYFGRAAEQLPAGRLRDSLIAMVGDALTKKAARSPAVQIAAASGLTYPAIGFWTLTMTVGSSFDVGRNTVELVVGYPNDVKGWWVEMRKGTAWRTYPPHEDDRKLDGGFGPFAAPRADALRAFFDTVARKAKIKLAWETLEVRSNLKKVDGVRKLFPSATKGP